MYNLLIGGAAGDGIETMSGLLEKTLKLEGFYLFSIRDFMSRVRCGHNYSKICFGINPIYAHRDELDGLVAFNEESVEIHSASLKKEAFILHDKAFSENKKKGIPINIQKLLDKSGSSRTMGTIYIGAILKLLGLGTACAEKVLQSSFSGKTLAVNQAALKLGYDAVEKQTESKIFPLKPVPETMLLTGSEAMALGALAGGIQFYSAYPMSPSTTLLDFFAKHSKEFCVGVEQGEDEIAVINMALGAAAAGAKAMVGTSGGGFSLMVEALGFAGIAEIPIVVANVMRPGPSTGLPTRTEQSDLSFVISASQGEFPRMVIAVREPADAFKQTSRAFSLAWKYQIPVILLSDQYLADSVATIPPLHVEHIASTDLENGSEGKESEYKRYKLTENGISPLKIFGKSNALVRIDSDEHDEKGVITEAANVRIEQMDKRLRKLEGIKQELEEPAYFGPEKPEILMVGFGSTAPAMREAVEKLNEKLKKTIGALCFGDVFPLPEKKLRRLSAQAKHVVNVEQNATGQLAMLIRTYTGIECGASILKYDGRQMSVDEIVNGIARLQLKNRQER